MSILMPLLLSWQAISVLDGIYVPPPASSGPLVLLRQAEHTTLTLGSLGYRVDSDLTLGARDSHSGQQLLPNRPASRRDPDKKQSHTCLGFSIPLRVRGTCEVPYVCDSPGSPQGPVHYMSPSL